MKPLLKKPLRTEDTLRITRKQVFQSTTYGYCVNDFNFTFFSHHIISLLFLNLGPMKPEIEKEAYSKQDFNKNDKDLIKMK